MTEQHIADELTAYLAGFRGSERLYKHPFGLVRYTDGARALARRAAAYWLLDAVASHQPNPLVRQEPFQVWTLSRATGRRFVLELTDGHSDRPLVRQEFEYSDFPLDSIKLYVVGGVLMLPGEY